MIGIECSRIVERKKEFSSFNPLFSGKRALCTGRYSHLCSHYLVSYKYCQKMLTREVWASKLYNYLEELNLSYLSKKKNFGRIKDIFKFFSSSKSPVSEGRIPWQYVTKHQQLFLHDWKSLQFSSYPAVKVKGNKIISLMWTENVFCIETRAHLTQSFLCFSLR